MGWTETLPLVKYDIDDRRFTTNNKRVTFGPPHTHPTFEFLYLAKNLTPLKRKRPLPISRTFSLSPFEEAREIKLNVLIAEES